MDDPRIFPEPTAAAPEFAQVHALANASLTAATGQEAARADAALSAGLDALLRSGDGSRLARLFLSAPSSAIYRHLWRLLAQRERAAPADPALAVTLFALPVIIVAGIEGPAPARATLPAIIDDVGSLVAILRTHHALAGNETFALGSALVPADALDLARLPELLAWRTLPEAPAPPRVLAPEPIVVTGGPERAHLRFLVGSALAAPQADPLRDAGVGKWGVPLAQALGRKLAAPGVSVLALPRAPQALVTAVANGRTAQREVAAQLFTTNAIRKLRATVGEPTAVISVHRVTEPPGGGEVRLSLSSPFAPREAEGFRCPLLALDRVDDVIKMLADLMRDCRVGDVRVQPGIHGDRDPATGLPLLFKADGPPPTVAIH